MNQLELILENIRLSHTERLLQEAQTDLELVRGQRLINESVMAIREALLQETVFNRDTLNRKELTSGGLGAIGGAAVGTAAAIPYMKALEVDTGDFNYDDNNLNQWSADNQNAANALVGTGMVLGGGAIGSLYGAQKVQAQQQLLAKRDQINRVRAQRRNFMGGRPN